MKSFYKKKAKNRIGEFNIEVQSVRTGLYLASGGSSDRQDGGEGYDCRDTGVL